MNYQITIPQGAWDAVTIKAAQSGLQPVKFLDEHLTEFIKQVKAEVHADVNTRLHKKIGGMTVDERIALATQIGA